MESVFPQNSRQILPAVLIGQIKTLIFRIQVHMNVEKQNRNLFLFHRRIQDKRGVGDGCVCVCGGGGGTIQKCPKVCVMYLTG